MIAFIYQHIDIHTVTLYKAWKFRSVSINVCICIMLISCSEQHFNPSQKILALVLLKVKLVQ